MIMTTTADMLLIPHGRIRRHSNRIATVSFGMTRTLDGHVQAHDEGLFQPHLDALVSAVVPGDDRRGRLKIRHLSYLTDN